MKHKMPWLKDRLRVLGRTPASLARHLNVAGPRVYEMIAGRRGLQPDEVTPIAAFLDWTVEDLLRHLPEEARIVPAGTRTSGAGTKGKPTQASSITVHGDLQMIPILGTTRHDNNHVLCDCRLTGVTTRFVESLPALRGRGDIQGLYMASAAMRPWRSIGELIVFEKDRPPTDLDYVVIYLTADNDETPVMVRQLIQTKTTKLRVRQHNPTRETEIDLSKVASIYRVMTWDDCVR